MSYHPGKANIVDDALSRKLLHTSTLVVRELKLIEQFRNLNMLCERTPNNVNLDILKLTSGVLEEIRDGQKLDLGLIDRMVLINQGKRGDFRINEDGVVCFHDKVCVPDVPELKKSIHEEGHKSSLSIYPDATEMYQDLR